MNQFIELAQAKKITIEDTMPDLTVLGDHDGLKQVVSILLDNAIKYSSVGSSVTISGEKKQDMVDISVADTGPGIRASDIPHIFDRFYRADSSRARKGENGYGLGLSIAKQIVDQHGGEIIATSTLNKGTTFTVRLPINES
jgi:signal transduction histidine kinase